ncbi:MAG: hypothetical protein JJU00_06450 [Opitutales bacterium]|nr:hypothetical protein [Opitutales bacterium]
MKHILFFFAGALLGASASGQLPGGSTFETENDDPARLFVVTDPMGFGWWPADATSYDPVFLTDYDDYYVPDVSGGPPALAFQKAGADLIQSVIFETPGQSGSNTLRNQPLTFFSFDDATDPGETFDGFFESEYFGVAWGGDIAGDTVFTWRIETGGQPFTVLHWWNHGLNEFQRMTATLYNANGEVLASGNTYFNWPGNENGNVGFTSFIEVNPTGEGDFVIVENQGQNVGWRATAVFLREDDEPPPHNPYPLDGGATGVQDDPVFGAIEVLTPEVGMMDWLGLVWFAEYPWIYQAGTGWWFHAGGSHDAAMILWSPDSGWVQIESAWVGWMWSVNESEWQQL